MKRERAVARMGWGRMVGADSGSFWLEIESGIRDVVNELGTDCWVWEEVRGFLNPRWMVCNCD